MYCQADDVFNAELGRQELGTQLSNCQSLRRWLDNLYLLVREKCIHIYIYIYIYIYIVISMYIYRDLHLCLFIYIYMYIYILLHTCLHYNEKANLWGGKEAQQLGSELALLCRVYPKSLCLKLYSSFHLLFHYPNTSQI